MKKESQNGGYMASPTLKTGISQGLTSTRRADFFHRLWRRTLKRERVQEFSPEIKLYDYRTIERCSWPQNAEGQYAEKFLTPLIKQGVQNYIQNVQTDLRLLIWDQVVLPITINEAEYTNSYVCSPYSYYISYAEESLERFTHPRVRQAMAGLLWGLSKVLRYGQVNKVVVVNNWFYSTNLYPHLQSEQLTMIARFLQQQFPDHAIVFRSVDAGTNPICYQTLSRIGFHYIANRQIFFINPQESSLFGSRLFKSDLKLLKNSGYEIVDGEQLVESDFPRLLELYHHLYIQKYSTLNPQFNENFLQLMFNQQLMKFKVLKKEGRIDGVIGYIQRHGMMFCPFMGYDHTLPKEAALYRLLSTVLMLEAHQQHLLFHQSSGASTFKTIRKAQACMEYMAVYYQHLKVKRRVPWLILKGICNSLGVFFMKRY